MHWVIIATFVVSAFQAQNEIRFAQTPYMDREVTQVVTDDEGRAVVFRNINVCKKVAAKVLGDMMNDPNIKPIGARCVRANVEE